MSRSVPSDGKKVLSSSVTNLYNTEILSCDGDGIERFPLSMMGF